MKKFLFFLALFSYAYAQEQPPPSATASEDKPKTSSAKPKPKPEAKPKGPDTQKYSDEEIGIQGSWRKKKDWLRQTLNANDALQEISTTVLAFKKNFYDKFQTIDSALDTFYRTLGLNREAFLELFKTIEKELTETREKTKKLFTTSLKNLAPEMQEEVKKIKRQYNDTFAIDEAFKQQENILEQLKVDAKTITDLDAAIKNRLKAVDTQVEAIGKKADEADELSKKVWYIIDDTKAKDAFYKVKALHQNAKNLKDYVMKDLYTDFQKIIKITNEQIKTITDSIKNIEKQGIIIANRAQRLEKERKQQLETLKKKEFKPQKARPSKVAPLAWYEQILKATFSFFGKIKDFIVGFFK